jgi:pimeloyl-ACP methyl ester carboxylesterase
MAVGLDGGTPIVAHDASAVLGSITAPALITFGRHDLVTSTRFARPLSDGIAGSRVQVFEDCSHAPIYENVDVFTRRTLDFLHAQSG